MLAPMTRSRIAGLALVWIGAWVGACASPSLNTPPPQGAPPPPSQHIIEAPTPPPQNVSAVGLTHLMRGLHFINSGKAEEAIPHLRLALMYDRSSPFIHRRLSLAWGASGRRDKAVEVLHEGLQQAPQDPELNLLAGQVALEEGDYPRALQHLTVAANAERTAAQAGPALVDAMLWLGKSQAAEKRARALRKMAPQDLELVLGLAGILEDHGRLRASLGHYRAARKQHPQSRRAALGETRVLDLLNQPAQAADALVSLFRYYPDAPDLYVEVTRYLRRAQHPDAEAYRAEALRQTEDDPYGRSLVATGDLLEGYQEQGMTLLERAVAKHPRHEGTRLYLAELYQQQGRTQDCLELLPPEGQSYLLARARCHAAEGDATKAEETLLRAVEAGLDPATALGELARHLAPRLAPTQARAAYRRLRSQLPELHAAKEKLAQAQLADALGEGERAVELLREVAEAQPHDPQHQLLLADLEVRYGYQERGLARLDTLVKEDPFDLYRLNAYGFTLADLGIELDRATVWVRRAYRMGSDLSFVIDSLGWLLHRQGQHDQAVRLLERAARASPNTAEILLHLGDARRAQLRAGKAAGSRSDTASIIQLYQDALRASPPPQIRQTLRERLLELGVEPPAEPTEVHES